MSSKELQSADLHARTHNIFRNFHSRYFEYRSRSGASIVRVSEKWRSDSIPPIAGADGRVIYNFGAGLPTIVCAPLRVCMVELQPGEKLEGEPQIGDSVRWNISPALYGNGDQATPQMAGLDTNLLITTDRRAYCLRLISKPQDYIARFAFRPVDQSTQRWQEQLAQQRQREREVKARSDTTPAMIAIEKMNFDYKVTGGNEHLRPVRVFDDSAKTYIQMPEEMQSCEAPVLLIVATDGKGEMSNYRVRQQTTSRIGSLIGPSLSWIPGRKLCPGPWVPPQTETLSKAVQQGTQRSRIEPPRPRRSWNRRTGASVQFRILASVRVDPIHNFGLIQKRANHAPHLWRGLL